MHSEITKDVEEERKKRFAAVHVPERPVRELTIGGLLPEKKKEKAWGGAMPKAPSFPSLSTIGSASINYAAIGKKEEKPRTSVSASPRDENALSNNAMLFPPLATRRWSLTCTRRHFRCSRSRRCLRACRSSLRGARGSRMWWRERLRRR